MIQTSRVESFFCRGMTLRREQQRSGLVFQSSGPRSAPCCSTVCSGMSGSMVMAKRFSMAAFSSCVSGKRRPVSMVKTGKFKPFEKASFMTTRPAP